MSYTRVLLGVGMAFVKVTIGPKGQIVIPKVFRDSYGLAPGTEVIVEDSEQKLFVRKPTHDIVAYLRAVAKKVGYRGPIDMDKSYDEMMGERFKHVLPGLKRIRKRGN